MATIRPRPKVPGAPSGAEVFTKKKVPRDKSSEMVSDAVGTGAKEAFRKKARAKAAASVLGRF